MSNTPAETCPACGSDDLHTPYASQWFKNAREVIDVEPGSDIAIACGECGAEMYRELDGELVI